MQEQVTQRTEIDYDPSTGLPTQTTTYSYLSSDQETAFTTKNTYAWQVQNYAAAMLQMNILTPIVQTVSYGGDAITASSVTTWKNWDGGGLKWASYQTYNWLGTGGVLNNDIGFNIGSAIAVKWQPSNARWEMTVQGQSQTLTRSIPIFGMSASQYAGTLDLGEVTPDLVAVFSDNGYSLSTAASVGVIEQNARWTIEDQSLQQVSDFTQGVERGIECWCYEQHQPLTNPCHASLLDCAHLSQYKNQLLVSCCALLVRLA